MSLCKTNHTINDMQRFVTFCVINVNNSGLARWHLNHVVFQDFLNVFDTNWIMR